jgi:hypothetical protein
LAVVAGKDRAVNRVGFDGQGNGATSCAQIQNLLAFFTGVMGGSLRCDRAQSTKVSVSALGSRTWGRLVSSSHKLFLTQHVGQRDCSHLFCTPL